MEKGVFYGLHVLLWKLAGNSSSCISKYGRKQHGLMPFLICPDTPVFKEWLQAGVWHGVLSGGCRDAAGSVLAQQEECPVFECGVFLWPKKEKHNQILNEQAFYLYRKICSTSRWAVLQPTGRK